MPSVNGRRGRVIHFSLLDWLMGCRCPIWPDSQCVLKGGSRTICQSQGGHERNPDHDERQRGRQQYRKERLSIFYFHYATPTDHPLTLDHDYKSKHPQMFRRCAVSIDPGGLPPINCLLLSLANVYGGAGREHGKAVPGWHQSGERLGS
jgi:hypothetical protein